RRLAKRVRTGAASERRDVLAEFPRRFRPARRLRRGDDWQAYTRRRVYPQAAFRVESPWHHHRSRFRGNAARRRGLAQGRDVELQGQPGWANRPRGYQDPQDSARRSQERSTVPNDPAASERLRGSWPTLTRTSDISSTMSSP